MTINFKYWDDCVDPKDLEAMWSTPNVIIEWRNAGETRLSKVHLSRDLDGQPFLTQTEIKAIAAIITHRHFGSRISTSMICALAELESKRQPVATRYNKKTKETTIGILQISTKVAAWLYRELGYKAYDIMVDFKCLYKPFVNVYLGAAYLAWLSTFDNKERNEEFMVRAFRCGTNKATHKSTLPYWRQYLSIKAALPTRRVIKSIRKKPSPQASISTSLQNKGLFGVTWDSRISKEDMEEMWKIPHVCKEWKKSGEAPGHVRIAHDMARRPYLSRIELKGVAEIIIRRHFSSKRIRHTVSCALAEVVSMRYVNGIGQRIGLMGIDYPTTRWLYKIGYKAYNVEANIDLSNPFISMYFGSAYLDWLSEYEGRERPLQFVVQAYLAGPKNSLAMKENGPIWYKFEQALHHFETTDRRTKNCTIL